MEVFHKVPAKAQHLGPHQQEALQHHWVHCHHPPELAVDWYGTTKCLLKIVEVSFTDQLNLTTPPQATTI